jgi:predicted dehydrogenase
MPKRVEVVATCDVRLGLAQTLANHVSCKAVCQDYRKILDRKDVEGVIVSTPDHWHALPTIQACQAGKHVYVEKPMTLTIAEGRRMVEAARKYRRVVQCGSQQRSTEPNRVGCKFLREGGLGKIERIVTYNFPSPWIVNLPSQPVPADLDWDRWCGPAPLCPYHASLFSPEGEPGWMSSNVFSGGEAGNWGGHAIGQVQWALGADDTGPVEVRVHGPALKPPVFDAPKPRQTAWGPARLPAISFRYASGVVLELSTGPLSGAIFFGEKGKMEIGRGSVHSNPQDLIANQRLADGPSYTTAHINNWIDCWTAGSRPVEDVEAGHRTATICHLVNIGRCLGRNLRWDPVTERFPGDDGANRMLDRPRRKGYELPETV